MKLPFSSEQFLRIFEQYNLAVWPIQFLLYSIGVTVALFIFNKKADSSRSISVLIGFLWLWMGAVYHLYFFTSINNAAYLFGFLFIIQGCLFLYSGYAKKITFQFSPDIYGVTGAILMLFSLVVYPVLGYMLGHIYPSSPTFGLPCPTTIFTFGLLLCSGNKFTFSLMIIPLIWSVIGFSAAFSLGMKEDLSLVISAVVFVFLKVFQSGKFRKAHILSKQTT
jgi:hypothetical protein